MSSVCPFRSLDSQKRIGTDASSELSGGFGANDSDGSGLWCVLRSPERWTRGGAKQSISGVTEAVPLERNDV
jgi:hypothetical protein